MDKRPRRNSLRYPGYDYSQSGATLVTICTHQNQRLFGTVMDGRISLSPAGTLVAECWSRLSERFPDILIDEYIVMPDHIHGILLTGTNIDYVGVPTTTGFALRSFKNSVVAGWRKGVVASRWPRYDNHLWHRDYYDRIIRNEQELHALRDYMAANPARWEAKQEALREDQRLRR